MYRQNEGGDTVVGRRLAAGSTVGAVAVRRRDRSLTVRPGAELRGGDASEPGRFLHQGRISAAELRPDHTQCPASRAAEDGMHVLFPRGSAPGCW